MPPSDTAVGFLLLGSGLVLVLAVVFAVTLRTGRGPGARAKPPRGVHVPAPSPLPLVVSLAAALLGAGLVFRGDDQPIANPYLAIPGVLVLVYAIWAWVRAAGREWRDVEHPPHDDAAGH
jgi:hypothetical protein